MHDGAPSPCSRHARQRYLTYRLTMRVPQVRPGTDAPPGFIAVHE